MQVDFEKFLKSLPQKDFVSVEDGTNDIWYSFGFYYNIYLALYSNQSDAFIKIQRVAGINESGDYELLNYLDKGLGCDAIAPQLIGSKNYYVSNSSDMKYIFIHND